MESKDDEISGFRMQPGKARSGVSGHPRDQDAAPGVSRAGPTLPATNLMGSALIFPQISISSLIIFPSSLFPVL